MEKSDKICICTVRPNVFELGPQATGLTDFKSIRYKLLYRNVWIIHSKKTFIAGKWYG